MEYVDEPLRWWHEQGARMIRDINEAIDVGSGEGTAVAWTIFTKG